MNPPKNIKKNIWKNQCGTSETSSCVMFCSFINAIKNTLDEQTWSPWKLKPRFADSLVTLVLKKWAISIGTSWYIYTYIYIYIYIHIYIYIYATCICVCACLFASLSYPIHAFNTFNTAPSLMGYVCPSLSTGFHTFRFSQLGVPQQSLLIQYMLMDNSNLSYYDMHGCMIVVCVYNMYIYIYNVSLSAVDVSYVL